MSEMTRPPIVQRTDGRFELRLTGDERDLLGSIARRLHEGIAAIADPTVPTPDEFRRLLPTAYPTDQAAQDKFDESQRQETIEYHVRALEILETTIDAETLSDEEASAWLDALVELRLVYGTSLGVEETWYEPDAFDPRYSEWLAYAYLTYLASEIVDALSPTLPPYDGNADDRAPDDPWGEPPGDLRWDGTPVPRDEPE
jgi:Domain of unknown function (DUF2017)